MLFFWYYPALTHHIKGRCKEQALYTFKLNWAETTLLSVGFCFIHRQAQRKENLDIWMKKRNKTNTSRYLQYDKNSINNSAVEGCFPSFLQFCSFVELTVKADKNSLMHEEQTWLPQGKEDTPFTAASVTPERANQPQQMEGSVVKEEPCSNPAGRKVFCTR